MGVTFTYRDEHNQCYKFQAAVVENQSSKYSLIITSVSIRNNHDTYFGRYYHFFKVVVYCDIFQNYNWDRKITPCNRKKKMMILRILLCRNKLKGVRILHNFPKKKKVLLCIYANFF